MRLAGRLAADVLDMIGPRIAAGMTTAELDRICHDFIVDVQKAIPAPLNYKGFPKSICTSVKATLSTRAMLPASLGTSRPRVKDKALI